MRRPSGYAGACGPGRLAILLGQPPLGAGQPGFDLRVLVTEGEVIAGFIIAGGETREGRTVLIDEAERALRFEYTTHGSILPGGRQGAATIA
jgi:hypothetical protein